MSTTTTNVSARVESLDYLRGIMAVCVLLYHFTVWTIGHQDVDTFLGKIGIYGVSIFYILSGLTLYLVYQKSLVFSWEHLNSFAIKRVFRIFPLLWLSILLSLLLKFIQHKPFPTHWSLWLNFTGLYGFISPGTYISTGAWSIGNELVFYALFPFILWMLHKSSNLFYSFWWLTCFIAVVSGFYFLDADTLLSTQWEVYINPFNQLFFFVGGIAIGTLDQASLDVFRYQSGRRLFFIVILTFILYPVEGNQIRIVSGWERIIFSALSFSICTSFYATRGKYIITPIKSILSFLGETSYSIYLLHPLVFLGLREWDVKMVSQTEHFILSLVLTLCMSYLSYELVEKPFVRLGKRLLS